MCNKIKGHGTNGIKEKILIHKHSNHEKIRNHFS